MNDKELELAGICLPELYDRLMNNTTLLRIVIQKFLEDPSCHKLRSAVEQGDGQAAEFACHTLKGVCGNLALTDLFSLTQEQLRLFRSGDFEPAAAMMPAITDKYETAVRHIRVWLSQA